MAFCIAKVIQEKKLIVHCSIAFSDILYVLLLKSTQLSSYAVCLLLGALLSLLKEESNLDRHLGNWGLAFDVTEWNSEGFHGAHYAAWLD